MKKSFLAIFLCLSFNLFSQTGNPVLFSDEFDNNNNGWPILSSTTSTNTQISDGNYNIKTKKESKSFHKQIPLRSGMDYSYEVAFQIEGVFSYVEIFFYNYNNEELGFVLYGSTLYSIYRYQNKKHIYIKQSQNASQCIPKTGIKKSIVMKVEQKGATTSFFINGILLYTAEDLSLPGNKLGFSVGENTKVSIEKYTVLQNNNGINLTNL